MTQEIKVNASPENICWSPKRLEHVFKTCLEDVFKMFSDVKSSRFRRRLQGVFQIHLQDVFKTFSKRLGRQEIIMLKTSLRLLQDMKKIFKSSQDANQDKSWGRLSEVLETIKMFTGKKYISTWKKYISTSNKSKFVSDKSLCKKPISDKSRAIPRQIQTVFIRTQ